MNLQSGVYIYDLPEDFGGIDSPMTYAPGQNVIYPPIEIIGEHHIRRLQQASTQADGRPTRAGFRQKNGIAEGGTRYEILFWPVPDESYELQYRYRVAPGQSVKVIHGGDAHYQTLLEAIRAAADNILRRRQRPHEAMFMERLQASVAYDQQLAAPKQMGYNRDGSDRPGYDIFDDSHRFGYSENAVTYNGNVY